MSAAPTTEGPARTAESLARSAGVVGVAATSSRLLGVVRDLTLAFFFGAGRDMDAFNVAFRIPNLVRDLFAEGAMTSAFVPTFTRQLALHGREAALRLGNHVVNGLLIVTGVVVFAGVLCARPLVVLLAGDYAEIPGKLELTVGLTRVLFPFLTLVAVAAACMGMLNSLGKFFVPSLSPAAFNVAVIFAAVALVPQAPAVGVEPIYAIAAGALLGGLGQILLQWPVLAREGFRYRPVFDPKDDALQRVLALMVPATLGLAAVQVNLLVATVLATGDEPGAVSWLNYAFRIMYLPIGLLGVSIATAALPGISREAARSDLGALRAKVAHALRLTVVLNVPAAAGLAVLADPIVRLLFERGRFGPLDTASTAAALRFYAPGLFGYSVVKLAAPSFYALGESRKPVAASVAAVALNVPLNIALASCMGFRGLALGTGLAALFNSGLLLAFLRRKIGGLGGARTASTALKTAAASAIMAAAAWAAERGASSLLPGRSSLLEAVRLSAAVLAGVTAFTATARALGIEEWREAAAQISRKFRRAPASTRPRT
ncbi:MAG: murein biosynthesis integral membrane protein MurJ [Planctomycetota bacterium]